MNYQKYPSGVDAKNVFKPNALEGLINAARQALEERMEANGGDSRGPKGLRTRLRALKALKVRADEQKENIAAAMRANEKLGITKEPKTKAPKETFEHGEVYYKKDGYQAIGINEGRRGALVVVSPNGEMSRKTYKSVDAAQGAIVDMAKKAARSASGVSMFDMPRWY